MTTSPASLRVTLAVPSDASLVAYVHDHYPDDQLAGEFEPQTSAPCPTVTRPLTVLVLADAAGNRVGAIVAQGQIKSRLHITPDGTYAELLVSWPLTQTWSHARCEFLKHQARVLCITRYADAAGALVARLREAAPEAALLLTFVGEWDETSSPLRKRLVARLLKNEFGPERVTATSRNVSHALAA